MIGRARLAGRGALAAGLASIAALGAATFSFVRATNFRGYDEWLIFWMLSRGLVSFPHAHRPLGLAWHLPAWWIAPDRLWGFALVHGFWLTATGVLTFLIVRRLSGDARLSLAAGALAVAWMPSETTRIVTVQMIQYSGCAAGTLLATWLLVEAWHRRSVFLLAAAAIAGAVAALSLEAALPQLAAAPLLLLVPRADRERRDARGNGELRVGRRWWIAGGLAFVGLFAARAALLLSSGASYQGEVLGGPRGPAAIARQLGVQLWLQLSPLAGRPPREMLSAAGLLAVLALLLGLAAVGGARLADSSRRATAIAGAIGLAHALLGYLPFVASRAVRGAVRTEFLSAAGIGVLLAAVVALLASAAPARARALVAAALASFVVASGTGFTVRAQREWSDALFAAQRRTLEQVAAIAPGLAPHTLVVLVQGGHTWGFGFSFSKAIEYLYADAARGFVPFADPLLVATRVERDAVVSEPARELQSGWGTPVERYRLDEIVVLAEDESGRLSIVDEWPEDLGPTPAGRYAPRGRIIGAAPPPARLSLLTARHP